jgi:hypothetical protein
LKIILIHADIQPIAQTMSSVINIGGFKRFIQKGNDLFHCADIMAFRKNKDKIFLIQAKFSTGILEAKIKFDLLKTPQFISKEIWTTAKDYCGFQLIRIIHNYQTKEWDKYNINLVNSIDVL